VKEHSQLVYIFSFFFFFFDITVVKLPLFLLALHHVVLVGDVVRSSR